MIEKAIRNAFEKGDADDRAFREKVYRSAFAALERALQANPNLSPDVVEKRREALQAKVIEIETEFIPAVPSVDPPSVQPQASEPGPDWSIAPSVEPDNGRPVTAAPPVDPVAARMSRAPDPVVAAPEPVVETPATPKSVAQEPAEPRLPEPPAAPRPEASQHRPQPEPFFPDVSDFDNSGPSPESRLDEAEVSTDGGPNVATERRRRPLTAVFLGVTVLALAAIGIWWGISTGLIKIPGAPQTDEITQLPPEDEEFTPGEEEAPLKPGEADAGRNWILVFSPSDPTTLNAPADTKAEVINNDSGDFVRIRSSAAGSAISFDVSKGVLEQLAGKHAVFDVVARAEEGKETQFSVDCNFGELGDCGRKRYQAGHDKGDFLFEMDLPAKAPGAEGTIAINSDVEGGGKALDVYEVKVSVSE